MTPTLSATEAARFEAANFALAAASENYPLRLSRQLGSSAIFVERVDAATGLHYLARRRWVFDSVGSHFPKFNLSTGGSLSVMCGLLVRWLRGGAIPPLKCWENVRAGRLLDDHHDEVVERLRAAGWPEEVRCVRCGAMVSENWDTWVTSLKVWGPTCMSAKWTGGECEEKT